jgi:ABC-2 type transport system permease protein
LNTTAGPAEIPDAPGHSHDGGSPAAVRARPARRVVYWSVRRELWEHRWLYIAPLAVAAVIVLGFAAGAIRANPGAALLFMPGALNFAAGALMATYAIVAVIYCLEALYGERRDRSILLWKSLPVSDLSAVLAKAFVALLALPLLTFALTAVTQAVMLLTAAAVLAATGIGAGALWTHLPVLPMWAALFYHLLTVHSLYFAPVYGWLLLVSAWARRAPFLWATLPVAAVLIVEKLVFQTSVLAAMLEDRMAGGPAAIPFPMRNVLARAPTLPNVERFLATPGLWIGLAVFAAFLAGAARLRRYQGPI